MPKDLGQEIQVGFIVFDAYRRAMEELLSHGQQNLLTKIQRNFGSAVSLGSVNPIVAQDYPKYLRYSIILLLYSFVENQLEEVCIKVGSDRNLSEEQVKNILGRNKLKNSKKFIRDNLVDMFQEDTKKSFCQSIENIFEPILFLSRVRNCIAHAGGDVSKSRDKRELQRGEKKYQGFRIDKNIIFLEEEFCQAVWIGAVSLFEDLSHLGCA